MTQIPNVNAEQIAECVERFRVARPHVHCITNTVAQNFTANVLLAAGGVPSMTIAAEEISDFVKMSDALLINLGTLDDERRVAVEKAVDTANQFKKPWVLIRCLYRHHHCDWPWPNNCLIVSPVLCAVMQMNFRRFFKMTQTQFP